MIEDSEPGPRLVAVALEALETGEPVMVPVLGVVLVPDTMVLWPDASGLPLPETMILAYDDGRTLLVYALPPELQERAG